MVWGGLHASIPIVLVLGLPPSTPLRVELRAMADATRNGVVSGDVGERLAEELNIKLDRGRSGQRTVPETEEEYEECWRQRAPEYGLDIDADLSETATGVSSRPKRRR